jgi:hypothetical protein
MVANWQHTKTISDGEKYEINGINIWKYKWVETGEKINIKDPLYGQHYNFTIYKIGNPEINIEFAAGEFSNCVWGIYENKSSAILDSKTKSKKPFFMTLINKYLGSHK